jgi:Sodium/hydrogen exchanger family
VLVVVALVARRFNIALPVLLVIAGILLALTPGLPRIELAPELVLLGILPPLIYSAGVAMSWREFRFNLRPIAVLAFGYVVFTTCAVAAMAHWLLGMSLAVAFVLGAIVSPTDAFAPVTLAATSRVSRLFKGRTYGLRYCLRASRTAAIAVFGPKLPTPMSTQAREKVPTRRIEARSRSSAHQSYSTSGQCRTPA